MNTVRGLGLLRHPVHFISLGGGLGLSPWAPGTWGTLPGFLIVAIMQHTVSWSAGVILLLLACACGVWCADQTARALELKDPGAVVCDEYLAFAGLLWCLPHGGLFSDGTGLSWATGLWAFLLFRLFDITKPFPVSWADQKLHGGLGIMVDDLLAAGWAYLCFMGLQALQLPGGP